MCSNLPPGCTDKDVDDSAPTPPQSWQECLTEQDKRDFLEAYWAQRAASPHKECDHCGEPSPEQDMVWVEPGNLGFSGWDGGMLLCETCAEDYKSGALDYE